MGSAAKDLFGLHTTGYGKLEYNYSVMNDRMEQTVFMFRPRALARRFSGFPFITSLQFGFTFGTTLVPLGVFERLLNANEIDLPAGAANALPSSAVKKARYQQVFVRLAPTSSREQREDMLNMMQSLLNPYYHQPIDTEEVINTAQSAADLIIYFFFFSTAIIMILDTFMLWLTFISNVRLNAWGFAVLRSLGFSIPQLTRAYIYESLCLVVSSFFVGTFIGISVALTLVLEMNLFMQLPFQFDFPWELFLFLFGLSLVAAVVGSFLPTHSICKRTIAQTLKKQ